MGSYYTKERLYREAHKLKETLGYRVDEIGFDIECRCNEVGIKTEHVPFHTKGLRGMAIPGSNRACDIILLSSSRTCIEQNFDCGHEVIHLGLHRGLNRKTFNCLEKVYANQDTFIEWQANEGAVEMFIPYKVLLPIVRERYQYFASSDDIKCFKKETAALFKVSGVVMEYRFESLKYEIYQYINGVPLNDIAIKSVSQQRKEKINVSSLNDLENKQIKKEEVILSSNKFINFESVFI